MLLSELPGVRRSLNSITYQPIKGKMIENFRQLNKSLIEIDTDSELNLAGKLNEVNQRLCLIIEDTVLNKFINECKNCKNVRKKLTLGILQGIHIRLNIAIQKIEIYMFNFLQEQNFASTNSCEELKQKLNDLQMNSDKLKKQIDVFHQKQEDKKIKEQIKTEKILEELKVLATNRGIK